VSYLGTQIKYALGLQVGLRRPAALEIGRISTLLAALLPGSTELDIAGIAGTIFTRTAATIQLHVSRKGGRHDASAINPQTAARLRAYFQAAGHGIDFEPLVTRPALEDVQKAAGHRDPSTTKLV
jgi:hypothetical protein